MDLYTSLIILASLSMLVMCVHSYRSRMIDGRVKVGFMSAFILIIIVSFAEWLGVVMNGWPSRYIFLHALVKALEFSLAPALLAVWTAVIGEAKRKQWLFPIIIINALLEFVSAFKGFIFYIDENNFYHRGEFYWIYITFYVFCVVMLFFEILRIGSRYQARNFEVLILIVLFLSVGIGIQMMNSEVRTTWISGAMAGMMFYVYYINLSLQVDSLTGLLNRQCFKAHAASIKHQSAIIMFDINNFKKINDSYGHSFGDIIMKEVSRLILSCYGRKCLCYRIGGDEFCVITKKNLKAVNFEELVEDLDRKFCILLEREKQSNPLIPTVSSGFAIYGGEGNIAECITLADKRMYENKKGR
ncbi:MAG: GGDEF domain-containing protein [Sphaerochaetaceae bacterium]|nr:GGDEF domain-containing protein [Sphaerochaetaceae bacterium]